MNKINGNASSEDNYTTAYSLNDETIGAILGLIERFSDIAVGQGQALSLDIAMLKGVVTCEADALLYELFDALDAAGSESYNTGFKDGVDYTENTTYTYEEGFNEGYDRGRIEGYDDGYEKGYALGKCRVNWKCPTCSDGEASEAGEAGEATDETES